MATLRYSDLLDIMLQRMQRLRLTATNGQADAAEVELYLFQALLRITEMVDIPAYIVRNQLIATTTTGQSNYPMPADYGRLILPRVQNKRGIRLFDTSGHDDLEYIEPNSFTRKFTDLNKRPTQFTVMQRVLWLYPPPDDNNTNNYTVRGVYIQRIERPGLDDEVLLDHPTALIDEALYRLASDMNRPIQTLVAARDEALVHLATGSR